jgi:hypothetical protein
MSLPRLSRRKLQIVVGAITKSRVRALVFVGFRLQLIGERVAPMLSARKGRVIQLRILISPGI